MTIGLHQVLMISTMNGDSMTASFADHFVRAIPIIGETLRAKRVVLLGLPLATPIVEYLAACGVGRWIIAAAPTQAESPNSLLLNRLHMRHGFALAPTLTELPLSEWIAAIRDDAADLIIAVGGQQTLAIARHAAGQAGIPALLCMPPSTQAACRAEVVFPGEAARTPLNVAAEWQRDDATAEDINAMNGWDWACAAPLLSGLARALLLRGSLYERPDLEELWARGMRIVTLGGTDPCAVDWSLPNTPIRAVSAHYQSPPMCRGRLLIAGLGSIGSVAAALLAAYATQLVLADPDSVDASNPARQHYTLADLGCPKACALQTSLAAQCPQIVAVPDALTDEDQVAALVRQHGITAALVATGTNADFAIARALRECHVSHVVARCYPRARYWEAILVDGTHGAPLDAIRGHLRIGPAPAPTPEQRAAYSDAGALEAEPATLIESGWAAAWAARLAWQLLMPIGLRERWMIEVLESHNTCLVGGAYVEHTRDGPAYAIDLPGRIRAWATEQIIGAV